MVGSERHNLYRARIKDKRFGTNTTQPKQTISLAMELFVNRDFKLNYELSIKPRKSF